MDLIGKNRHQFALQNFMKEIYGIDVENTKQFYSFEDCNIFIEDNSTERHKYVLKILIQEISLAVIDQINKALKLLNDAGFSVPLPIKNKSGTYSSFEDVSDIREDLGGKHRLVVLLKYVPGKTLADLLRSEMTQANFDEVLEDCGRRSAQIAKYLTFNIELDWNVLDRPENTFKLERVTTPNVEQRLQYIADEDLRKISEEVIEKFTGKVVPKLALFQDGIINGDVNQGNILLQKSPDSLIVDDMKTKSSTSWKYCGMIDFMELSASKLVFELATLQAFMMISAKTAGFDIWSAFTFTLNGFEKELKLNIEERNCLYLSVATRLASLLCCCGHFLTAEKTKSIKEVKAVYFRSGEVLKQLYNSGKL